MVTPTTVFMRNLGIIALIFVVGLAGVLVGHGGAMAAAVGTLTDDTFVRQSQPADNFDAGSTNGGRLTVDISSFFGGAPTRDAYALLQFDLSGVTDNLSDASLILTLDAISITGADLTIGLYPLVDGWDETTVTYDDALFTEPPADAVLQQVVLTPANVQGEQVIFNATEVGAYIEQERVGDGIVSFLLRADSFQQNVGQQIAFGVVTFEDQEDSAGTGGAPFIDNTPLAVTVGYFFAERWGDTVAFVWQTATETGNAGFNLLAETPDGLQQLNEELIPSPVIDSVVPTDYEFVAPTDATVFYLEEVSVDGSGKRVGPFDLGQEYGTYTETDPDVINRSIYLPVISR